MYAEERKAAILATNGGFELTLAVRESVLTREKARIAEAALARLPEEACAQSTSMSSSSGRTASPSGAA